MEIVIIICLAGSAAIHLLPVVGALGPSRVARTYDITVDGADVAVLLVHRAIMFGLLGAALIGATFHDSSRPYVIAATLISDVAFLVIARLNPGINRSMRRVVLADVISTALLMVAGIAVFAS